MSAAGEATPVEEQIVRTQHTAMIGGRSLAYSASVGSIVVRHDPDNPIGDASGLNAGQAIAELFFTTYTLDGADAAQRPVSFAFNGGPGSSSVWLHFGLLGPRRMPVANGRTVPPFTLVDNDFSLLSDSDVVMVDPIGTGLSRAAPGFDPNRFADVEPDAKLVAAAIVQWLTANRRWPSPKYILGESYGGVRGPLVVRALQERHTVFPSGLILISPALDYALLRFNPGNDLPFVAFLPTFAASAWFHQRLANPLDLHAHVAEAEAFAGGDYLLALARGDRLSAAARGDIAAKVAKLCGLSREFVEHSNLRITESRFRRELLRAQRLIIGRADSRFTGADPEPAGAVLTPDTDPSVYMSLAAPYTSAFNAYLRDELGCELARRYEVFHPTLKTEWKYAGYKNRTIHMGEVLRSEMCRNPQLRLYVATGYYDLATPHFQGDHAMDHLNLPAAQLANVTRTRFDSGHMMYIHDESLTRLAADLRGFVRADAQRG
jgi:carboxypeptidase C (cathepsin A)